jgi:hypothetical protein
VRRRTIVAAAPGRADTGQVLRRLAGDGPAARARDLGGLQERDLARWERAGRLEDADLDGPTLFWCPCGREGLSLRASLVLGRLAALIGPARLTVLWFPEDEESPARPPAPALRARVASLARVAWPGGDVRVHCAGWDAPVRDDLDVLARQFA